MSTLDQRITEARKGQGLSPSELAKAIGVTGAAVSRWENGQVKNLRMDHLFDIARLLKVNPEWLATGNGRKQVGQVDLSDLSQDEQFWLDLFRSLTPSCRKNLKKVISQYSFAEA